MPNDTGQELAVVKSVLIPGLSEPLQMAETKARRQMFPKEQWLAMKPIIQRLYIDEGQTFMKVAEYLDRNHGFKPTKKQFLTRVKEWGFQKNVKQDERRAILESLGKGCKNGDFKAGVLRGRKLDMAKIERWKKREGIVSDDNKTGLGEHLSSDYDESRLPIGGRENMGRPLYLNDEAHSASMRMKTCSNDELEEEAHLNGTLQVSMIMDHRQLFNPWSAVDIVGSPRLTRLIGALTLETCSDIPDLDLSAPDYKEADDDDCELIDADETSSIALTNNFQTAQTFIKASCSRVSSNIAAILNSLAKERQRWMPGPLDEICVFPETGYRKRILEDPKTDHLFSEESLKANELECKRRLKAWGTLSKPKAIKLVERMRSVAHRHFELYHDRLSEIWWRRVVTCSLKVQEYSPLKLLHACLQVVRGIKNQGRRSEAKKLHRGLHEKIINLLSPEHELGMISAHMSAQFLNISGYWSKAASIYRQNLQIYLRHYGPRNTLTLQMLLWLGRALNSCDQTKEAETLLRIRLDLERETFRHVNKTVTESEATLLSLTTLSWALQWQDKYDESCSVLELARNRFSDLLVFGPTCCWDFYVEQVDFLRAKGRLTECEELLLACLKHISNTEFCALTFKQKLAEILTETHRITEAAIWLEQTFLEGIKRDGIEHWRVRIHCEQLGFCYADQGRYEDAILHFQQTIERLSLGPVEDPESRAEFVDEIQKWTREVEEMRQEAEAEASATSTVEEIEEDFVDFSMENELTAWYAADRQYEF